MVERDTQVRVAAEQRLGGAAKSTGVENTVELHDDLHVVDVLSGVVVKHVEQKPFLQGRQRQDVFETRTGGLEMLYIHLR